MFDPEGTIRERWEKDRAEDAPAIDEFARLERESQRLQNYIKQAEQARDEALEYNQYMEARGYRLTGKGMYGIGIALLVVWLLLAVTFAVVNDILIVAAMFIVGSAIVEAIRRH